MKTFKLFLEHPGCGTPDCCMQCDTAVIEEEAEHEGRKVKLNDPFVFQLDLRRSLESIQKMTKVMS